MGFDFLGFTIRPCTVGKYQSRKLDKTIIKPSKPNLERHYRALAEVRARGKAQTLDQVISARNKNIVGWCNDDKTQGSTEAFQR